MDSVTQLALGAAVGEAVLGQKVGRKAALWGAICGTLPDLDVLIPLGDAVRDFTYHRGPSHSIFVLTLLTPLMVYLIHRLHPGTGPFWRGWTGLVLLVFCTHVLLDCFTVYGTQILWPFDPTPVTWSTIFIIDPLYTLPLVLGLLSALMLSRAKGLGRRLNVVGLILSTLYLGSTVGAKMAVEDAARASLRGQNVAYEQLITIPTPFNTVLWRVLAMTPTGYVEGFHSLFDGNQPVRFTGYPSDSTLLAGLDGHWPVARLKWFTKGFYGVSREGTDVVISDLRMGVEPSYVFRFKVGEIGNPHAVPTASARLPMEQDMKALGKIWERVWGGDTDPAPSPQAASTAFPPSNPASSGN